MSARWWSREDLARRRPNLIARNRIAARLRARFAADGFVEVETPVLQARPNLERHIRPLETQAADEDGVAATHWLHTSPEFACKKLLAAGEPKLFTLARVFRDAERSPRHHPEFTMLEWYRAPGDWREIMDDCRTLLRGVAKALEIDAFRAGAVFCDPFADWEEVTVADALARHAGVDIAAGLRSDGAPDRDGLARAAQGRGWRVANDDGWGDIFTKLMVGAVEPQLGRAVPTFITRWPAPEAALARRTPDDPRFAERFELYVAGMELVNAYGELTDAVEQRARFDAEADAIVSLRGPPRPPIDEDLLAALPLIGPAAGAALGLDRLVMLATGARDIRDVLWAPVGQG